MSSFAEILHGHRSFLTALTVVAFAVIVAAQFDVRPAANAPRVAGGAIDLSQWDFARDGAVSLAGQWRYDDMAWVDGEAAEGTPVFGEVPGAWPVGGGAFGLPRPHGYATYSVVLKLPPATGERLAINTGYVLAAYRVLVNGREVAASGKMSKTAAGETPRAYGLTVPLNDAEGTITLQIQQSNHVALHGGFFGAPSVGLESAFHTRLQSLLVLSIFLVGAMAFAAAYHLTAFALARGRGETLWFGIFAALLAIRTLLIEPLAPFMLAFIGQDWLWRIDYAASILLLPAVYHFFALSFPNHVAERGSPWVASLCGVLAGATLVGGTPVGELALKAYELIALAAMAYLSVAVGRAAWMKEPGGALALTGWLLSAAASVHDIMMDNGFIVGPNMIPIGFLAFFLCLSGTMVARFRNAYVHATQTTHRMKALNEDLEAAVERRTRELERAKAEAESANIAKSRFLATMSHELRTPLNAILGFSEMIEHQALGPAAGAKYSEYAHDIHRSGAHLLSLINDILDLSQIEAGKRDLHDEEIDVAELAHDALTIAASRERRAKEHVTLAIAPDLPRLRADRRAVLQMLVNLLTNALKFTPDGKSIVVQANVGPGGGIAVSVADEGVGMAREDIPKALALFSQVDDGHTRRHEGTGLGLPIVKSLIELHGGTFALDGEKGRGTTAVLHFPAARTLAKGRVAA